MTWIDIICTVAAFAAINMYIGWEKGSRLYGTLVLAVLTGLLTSSALIGGLLGLSFYIYRSIGWHGTLDMGRNEGRFIDDFFKMSLISAVAGIGFSLVLGNPTPMLYTLMAPLSYTVAMWAFPWKPNVPHIKIAEGLSGASLGFLTAISI